MRTGDHRWYAFEISVIYTIHIRIEVPFFFRRCRGRQFHILLTTLVDSPWHHALFINLFVPSCIFITLIQTAVPIVELITCVLEKKLSRHGASYRASSSTLPHNILYPSSSIPRRCGAGVRTGFVNFSTNRCSIQRQNTSRCHRECCSYRSSAHFQQYYW